MILIAAIFSALAVLNLLWFVAALRTTLADAGQDGWGALSHILPGGRTSLKDAPVEKIYIVVAGEVVVETETDAVTLGVLDSCRLAPGEARALSNRTNAPASILLAMPTTG